MEVIKNNSDSESIYMNEEEAVKTSNQNEIYSNIHLNIRAEIPGSTGACERRKVNFSHSFAVALGFLCVLLMAVITVLCMRHNEEMRQIQSSNASMAIDRDRLQSNYNNMTTERDRLQSSYNNMTIERDRLQSSWNILNMEKEQLINQNRELSSEKKQLQMNFQTLTSERDAMQKKLTEIDSCPYGWMKFSSSCYIISSIPRTWEESRQDCMRSGADLVIINSREEQQFASDLKTTMWIGLTDSGQEGQWKWLDNSSMEHGYWKANEPNNAGNEDCAEISFSTIIPHPVMSNWNDISCDRILNGLCEKKIWCSTQ